MQISEFIIFQSHQYVVANKPAGISVQPDESGDKSLLEILEIYCKSTLYVVHRIDRPVSGVVILAKTKKAAASFGNQFQAKAISKTYLTAVKDAPKDDEGELRHYMKKIGKVEKIFNTPSSGTLEAVLQYRKIGATDNYTFLEVTASTGRFHQIRAQLGAIGSPIKGDTKYGFKRGNTDRSIHLHAWKIQFAHPITGAMLNYEAPLPQEKLWQALAHLFEQSAA